MLAILKKYRLHFFSTLIFLLLNTILSVENQSIISFILIFSFGLVHGANDIQLIQEFSTFVKHGQSFQAEEGHTDDLAMCCVLFGWMTNQTYFKELTNVDIRERMFLEQQDQLEQDMAPFGFMDNGIDDPMGESIVDEYGQRWSPVVRDYSNNW